MRSGRATPLPQSRRAACALRDAMLEAMRPLPPERRMERTSGNRAIKMENMQVAQVAPGAGENPEMSRRGAFAAGGLALAALVAGGCGWLAMNAGKSTAGPELTAKIVDGPGSGKFAGTVYQANVAEDEKAMNAAGISASLVRTRLGAGARQQIVGNAQTSYASLDLSSATAGVPYLVACDVYALEWETLDGVEDDGAPLDRDDDGTPGRVASRTYLTRVGAAVVPDGTSGTVTLPFEVPEANCGANARLALRPFWQRLDIH